ncbi:GNAT family N-acetyltransferase [Microbulbifer sp. OS29]|uniref:GNAT family N-acetyltransferase n=1 Tax=Microbulbifer okhotskensis TaxID=2926617 RepID=A0A9X2EQG4_9GAMM|nr:GNAT family N-acetyltransferase [Microbulbifer okhotskensis]MCO1333848.1 GNAT family N-acetyltransferase [Microbulbifer okhotskensis]
MNKESFTELSTSEVAPPVSVILADYGDPQHARDILALMDEYAQHPFGGGEALPEHTRSDLVPALREFPGAFSVLAYKGAIPVGLVNCLTGFSTFLCKPLVNIHDVVVNESARGAGVCTAMLDFVARNAKEKGCCKLTLEILEKNFAAQAAYLKVGFKPYTLDEEFGRAEFWQRYL